MEIKTSVLWTVSAKRFLGIGFHDPTAIYSPLEIKRLKELRTEHASNMGTAVGAAMIGGAILGPAGLVAGAAVGGNTKKSLYGIEFLDGKKAVFEVEAVNGSGQEKAFRCMYLYARGAGLVEIDF